ncbi:hypothetical protein C9374_000885 [Naegleria lovaniensis]|uniref:Uncharacterized protein n=1 Tax=Naegleria lovaniensis TaxID=51637 RepID=A0AA88GW33_NAELO|nr:uncharacterized protein C9374_000885 [Naegleria lovaniensis]KAG2388035.1 hypothetical protein C9374_000885 [Naegleria lovaniensis]
MSSPIIDTETQNEFRSFSNRQNIPISQCFLATLQDQLFQQVETPQPPMLHLDVYDFCKTYYELLIHQENNTSRDPAQLNISDPTSGNVVATSDSFETTFLDEPLVNEVALFEEQDEITEPLFDLEPSSSKATSPVINDPALQPDHSADALSVYSTSYQSAKKSSPNNNPCFRDFINTTFTSSGKRIEKKRRKKIPKKQLSMQFNFPMWTFHLSTTCTTKSKNVK